MENRFIVFEGPDGAGKTTQIKLLDQHLCREGYKTLLTREPGGCRISENIRDMILDNSNEEMCAEAEALLYAAARAQHVKEVIQPALDRGEFVLCDRFIHSSVAYQGYGRAIGEDRIMRANELALGGLMPDLVFFFLLPIESSKKRIRGEKDRLENAGDEFHARVLEGFTKLSGKENAVRIDATQKINIIHDIIKSKINEYGGL